jgi:glycosyl transferase family 87
VVDSVAKMNSELAKALSKEEESRVDSIVFGVIALIVLFNVHLLWITKDKILEGYGDFASFYASALIVRDGRGRELYNYETQREIQSPLFSRVEIREDALPYVHLAYETLVYIPLTFFTYSKAAVLWVLINLVMIGLISLYVPFYLPRPRISFRVFLLLCLLASFPVLVTLIQGQDSIILLFLYSFAYIFLKRGKPAVAGAVLALGLFKFQLVLPFVGIFLLEREWRFIKGFVAASTVPIITSLYIAGMEGTLQYVRFLVRFSQSPLGQFEIEPWKMPNLRGILYAGLSVVASPKFSFIATIIGSITVVIWAIRASRSEPLEVRFSLALLVSLAVSHYLFVYDLAIVVLPVFIMVDKMALITTRRLGLNQATFLILCVLLLMSPSHLAMIYYGVVPSLMALPVLGLILLTGKHHSPPVVPPQLVPLATDDQP